MTDSPAYRGPALDPQEQPILDRLLTIRDKLLLLKQDKTKYVKSCDVVSHYDQIIEQVEQLNNIREDKPDEQNRLDTVLDDCFQLISLFFMTIGKNNEAPAAYSLVSTIKRLLDHLKEAAFFAHKDLEGISHKLQQTEQSLKQNAEGHNTHMCILLRTRITNCRATLEELQGVLSEMSPELLCMHEKLVCSLRTLSGLNTKPRFPTREVKDIQKKLKDIETQLEGTEQHHEPSNLSLDERIDHYANKLRQVSYSSDSRFTGKAVIRDLLERCSLWSEIMLQRQGKIDERFRDTFDHLYSIRNSLEKLLLTQAWSLRETDLYSYQRKLDRVDETRVDGNFLDANGQPADLYEQRTLLYLLRKSYACIYIMLTSSEPVSEALLPVYNQLSTLRRCLEEVKRSGGVSSARELYPYSMKLNSIDNMRHDGVFRVNDDIPEGQGAVIQLLSECFDIAYDLRTQAEKEEEEEEQRAKEHDDDNDGPNGREEAEQTESEEEDEEDPGEGMEMKKVLSNALPSGRAVPAA